MMSSQSIQFEATGPGSRLRLEYVRKQGSITDVPCYTQSSS